MDIVTSCNVPRYLHNDLPLGNPLGPPYDKQAQRQSIVKALEMVEKMCVPGVSISALSWPAGNAWKKVYGQVTKENRAKLLKMGMENRARRASDKARGLAR